MHIQKQDKITHLGANSDYPDQYAPALLEALPRARGRDLIGVDEQQLPFSGFDLWTALRSIIRSEDLTLRASAEAPSLHPMGCNFALQVDSLERAPLIPDYPNVKRTRSYSVFIGCFIVER